MGEMTRHKVRGQQETNANNQILCELGQQKKTASTRKPKHKTWVIVHKQNTRLGHRSQAKQIAPQCQNICVTFTLKKKKKKSF